METACFQREPSTLGILDYALNVATAHQFGNQECLALVVSQVEDRHDVGVGAEAAHGLGLAGDALTRRVVEAFGVD